MDWGQYAVGGAASRDDSFTGLNPDFAQRAYALTQAAHAAGIPLQVTSAYRSPEVQARLYEAALAKYGSPEAARKWVAPPGRSQHNRGTAIDFAVNGSLIRDPSSPEAQWLRENASQYGLELPMEWEPWQVELAGARNGSAPPPMRATQGRNALSDALPANDSPQGPANVLAAPSLPDLMQDPEAFQSAPRNALSTLGFNRNTNPFMVT